MNYLIVIKSLYVVNGFAAVLMYLPQIVNVWKDGNNGIAVSLLTFGGWSIGSFITVLYAWMFVNDRMFAAVSLGNLIGSGAIFCIVAAKRFRERKRSAVNS